MLSELLVRDLGVIDELSLVLGEGMTAVTGETGAGKTLIVGAIDLLTGGRADASLVRPGAEAEIRPVRGRRRRLLFGGDPCEGGAGCTSTAIFDRRPHRPWDRSGRSARPARAPVL